MKHLLGCEFSEYQSPRNDATNVSPFSSTSGVLPRYSAGSGPVWLYIPFYIFCLLSLMTKESPTVARRRLLPIDEETTQPLQRSDNVCFTPVPYLQNLEARKIRKGPLWQAGQVVPGQVPEQMRHAMKLT